MDVLNFKKSTTLSLDVVVPVYNEESCVEEFVSRTCVALDKLSYPYRILFVDDGSTDGSLELIRRISSNNNNVEYLSFSRNFGKEAALTAGLNNCQADAVAIIDADLQDPPELIPEMMKVLEQKSVDVVYGKRKTREGEGLLKKATASVFYKVFDRLSRFNFPRDTGDFRVLRKNVVDVLRVLNEQNRFMKGLFAWVGFKQVEFLYDRDPRYRGKSKFNFFKLWNFALDGFTAFTPVPLKLATYAGLFFSFSAVGYGIFFILKTLFIGEAVKGFPTLIVAMSFFSGIQLLFLGVIGEYLARVHEEVKGRPEYVVAASSIDKESNEDFC